MPEFVLLEHQWNGVHWDLMLETGEVLRTWAIDAPIVSNQDLPARELKPHRRIYLQYEGEVSGNRGSVRQLDRGTYQVLAWEPDLVRVEFQGRQLVGEAEFRRRKVEEGIDTPDAWNFRLGNFD